MSDDLLRHTYSLPLSILVVTRADPRVLALLMQLREQVVSLPDAELVLVADGHEAAATLWQHQLPVRSIVFSNGCLESIYDEALAVCRGDYILRLDDDEAIDDSWVRWLQSSAYLAAPIWRFARRQLWQRVDQYIRNFPLWPNYQVRLSTRALSGGRATTVHAASPHGKGTTAPVVINHHKFLLYSPEERQAQRDRYNAISPGSGDGKFLPHLLPEQVYPQLELHRIDLTQRQP